MFGGSAGPGERRCHAAQPFVTTAQMQSDQIRVALDLTEEWDRLQADSETPSSMITGVLIGRRSLWSPIPTR